MSIQSNFPAINPSLNLDFANVKALDPRITFTRASTAKYYDGVTTAKAEENLVLQSQDFNTASWSTTGAIIGNTTTAPDGTTTAESFNDTVSNTFFITLQTYAVTAGVTYTYSIFAKANAQTWVQLTNQTAAFGSNAFANFNLSTGAVGVVGSGCTASIVSVGNGWYRCVIVATAIVSGNGGLVVALTNSTDSASRTPTYTGAGTGIFIWGAQLEQRSSVTAYTPTTTQAITNYIPVMQTAAAGVARFDHNPTTGESLGLLIEEQRTNLVTYSEQFDNAAWTKTRSSITANTIVAPDGTLTGDKLVEDTQTGSHYVYLAGLSYTSGTSYTLSLYVKAGGRSKFMMYLPSSAFGGTNISAVFNLNTASIDSFVSPGVAVITSVGNGWYRCSVSATASTTTSGNTVVCWTYDGSSNSYTGDGYSGIYIWGAQLEAGAFPTSYIPTGASQVTRATDAASMTGTNFSSWYRQDEGTLYAEAIAPNGVSSALQSVASITNSANDGRVLLYRSTGSQPVFQGDIPGSQQFQITSGSWANGASQKLAGAYRVNDFAASFNAGTVGTDTLGTLPTVDRLVIGDLSSANRAFCGTIKKFAYYPLRVTNTQLQALTS